MEMRMQQQQPQSPNANASPMPSPRRSGGGDGAQRQFLFSTNHLILVFGMALFLASKNFITTDSMVRTVSQGFGDRAFQPPPTEKIKNSNSLDQQKQPRHQQHQHQNHDKFKNKPVRLKTVEVVPLLQSVMDTHTAPTVIAYAVSITSCSKRSLVSDGAAVLQHSIHLNSIRTNVSGSRYDYEMVAFVLPEAIDCVDIFNKLNYTVYIKPVPIQIDQIRGTYRRWANRTGCCGEKEWLKLYSYTLTQFPVVVHLDLDCLVLKPLDDLFDAMIQDSSNSTSNRAAAAAVNSATKRDTAGRERIPAMWVNATDMPETIDAFFTRDYGMIGVPGRRKPHQIGVQGGFLVLRPNQTTFEEYIKIILEGNYTERDGWGDKLGYGGYYGAGNIQGLAAMYYSHLYPHRAVELNRCIYNNMVDIPYPKKYDTPEFSHLKPYPCISLQESCDDCRLTPIEDIVTIHLTNCLKPWHCVGPRGVPPLCVKHWYEWYRVRYLLEAKWRGQAVNVDRYKAWPNMTIARISLGFCTEQGQANYRPIDLDLAPPHSIRNVSD